MNTDNIKITEGDYFEYELWQKDKTKVKPRILKILKSEEDYEEFMKGTYNETPNIINDPAIIRSQDKVHVNNQYRTMSNFISKEDLLGGEGDDGFTSLDNLNPLKVFKGFGFEVKPSEEPITAGNVIGTLTMSQAYIHLFHYTTYGQYPAHVALHDLYEEIGDKIDALAESVLAFKDVDQFENIVLPETCPLEYILRLRDFCERAKTEYFNKPSDTGYVSQLDDISNELAQVVYRLKRLKVGYKWFTNAETREFGLFKEKKGNYWAAYLLHDTGNDTVKPRADFFSNYIRSEIKEEVKRKNETDKVKVRYLKLFKQTDKPDKGEAHKYLKEKERQLNEKLDKKYKNKTFSEISSDDAFRKYAHNVMKNAHGDNYSEEVTDKVVDDLLASPHDSYGELIGRLTSGLGK